jgi:hypothetical protein
VKEKFQSRRNKDRMSSDEYSSSLPPDILKKVSQERRF